MLLGACFLAALAAGASDSDQAQVGKLIDALNSALNQRNAALLAKVVRAETQLWPAGALKDRIAKELPWSERMAPYLEGQSTRFVSPARAVVTAHLVRRGPVLKESETLVALVGKIKGEWRFWYVGLFRNSH